MLRESVRRKSAIICAWPTHFVCFPFWRHTLLGAALFPQRRKRNAAGVNSTLCVYWRGRQTEDNVCWKHQTTDDKHVRPRTLRCPRSSDLRSTLIRVRRSRKTASSVCNAVNCLYVQVVITPTAMCPKSAEWYQMQISKGCPDKSLKIKIAIRIDKPQNMKHAGCVCVR